jgi:hypothetical protein
VSDIGWPATLVGMPLAGTCANKESGATNTLASTRN